MSSYHNHMTWFIWHTAPYIGDEAYKIHFINVKCLDVLDQCCHIYNQNWFDHLPPLSLSLSCYAYKVIGQKYSYQHNWVCFRMSSKVGMKPILQIFWVYVEGGIGSSELWCVSLFRFMPEASEKLWYGKKKVRKTFFLFKFKYKMDNIWSEIIVMCVCVCII